MTHVLAIQQENATLTAADLKSQAALIQTVLEAVMRKGVHYDTIPGTDKPTLLKPGAEKIMATFRLAADPEVDDLSGPDDCTFRVRAKLMSPSGRLVGTGIGQCSSSEEKYRWRSAVCDEEFEATPENRRREKWKKGQGSKAYCVRQVRTEPADVANTVLKMAKKRALVDAVLTATAASDIFEQDLDEMDRERPARGSSRRGNVSQPRARSETGPITDGQLRVMTAKASSVGVTMAEVAQWAKVDDIAKLPAARVNEVLQWLDGMTPVGD